MWLLNWAGLPKQLRLFPLSGKESISCPQVAGGWGSISSYLLGESITDGPYGDSSVCGWTRLPSRAGSLTHLWPCPNSNSWHTKGLNKHSRNEFHLRSKHTQNANSLLKSNRNKLKNIFKCQLPVKKSWDIEVTWILYLSRPSTI